MALHAEVSFEMSLDFVFFFLLSIVFFKMRCVLSYTALHPNSPFENISVPVGLALPGKSTSSQPDPNRIIPRSTSSGRGPSAGCALGKQREDLRAHPLPKPNV